MTYRGCRAIWRSRAALAGDVPGDAFQGADDPMTSTTLARTLLTAAVVTLGTSAHAQTPYLVADVRTGVSVPFTDPQSLTATGDAAYFLASLPSGERALMRIGANHVPVMVRTVTSGSGNSKMGGPRFRHRLRRGGQPVAERRHGRRDRGDREILPGRSDELHLAAGGSRRDAVLRRPELAVEDRWHCARNGPPLGLGRLLDQRDARWRDALVLRSLERDDDPTTVDQRRNRGRYRFSSRPRSSRSRPWTVLPSATRSSTRAT